MKTFKCNELDRSLTLAVTYRGMEHIDGLHRCFSFLLVAEYQIDPVGDSPSHMIGFESLSMNERKQPRIIPAPRWQRDVINRLARLALSEIET